MSNFVVTPICEKNLLKAAWIECYVTEITGARNNSPEILPDFVRTLENNYWLGLFVRNCLVRHKKN